jgi:hypothetical protein
MMPHDKATARRSVKARPWIFGPGPISASLSAGRGVAGTSRRGRASRARGLLDQHGRTPEALPLHRHFCRLKISVDIWKHGTPLKTMVD